jgi:site-specific DNA recombinase
VRHAAHRKQPRSGTSPGGVFAGQRPYTLDAQLLEVGDDRSRSAYALPMTAREDRATLEALGLTEEFRRAAGLWEAAAGDPDSLMDVYLRRSAKKEDLAVLRGHLRDCLRWASAEGVAVRHVWFEQLSASKSYVRRREFEKATQAILDGRSKTLAVWKTDRFDRRGMGAVGRMLDEFEKRRARLVSVSEGLDSRKGGRMVFAILSERAREEAKDIAARVQIGHDSHKAEGRRGTGAPPYGLYSAARSGTVEPHREEYAVARKMAEMLLGGSTASETAYAINAAGGLTRSGKPWTGPAISRLVQSPMFGGMIPNAERRVDDFGNPLGSWRGYSEPLADAKGVPLTCGTGVVTTGEWYRIRAAIAERTNPAARRGKPAVKYMLSGILRCGRCGGTLNHRGGSYQCVRRHAAGPAACKGVSTLAERADTAVGDVWVSHVASLEPEDAVLYAIARRWLALSDPASQAEREGYAKALESAQGRVKRLEDDYYVRGKMDEVRYEELSSELHASIETLSAQLEHHDGGVDISPLMNGELLRGLWYSEKTTLATRRMLLRCALEKVILLPAKYQGDKSAIRERLVFDWVSDGEM